MIDPLDIARVEAFLHAKRRPVPVGELARAFPNLPYAEALKALEASLVDRGITLTRAADGWCLRTRTEASDIAQRFSPPPVKLSKAALEVLAIIAAFQTVEPVTRSEIERVRHVQLSPGIFDALFEAGFIKPGRRRETPGRPLTWVTTERFLEHFDIESIPEIDTVAEMKAAGLLVLPSRPAEDTSRPS